MFDINRGGAFNFDSAPVGGSGKLAIGRIRDRLRWETTVGVPKERRYVRVSSVASDVDIVPFNNDLATLHRAVTERVFCVKNQGLFCSPPRPDEGYFDRTMFGAFELLRSFLPSTAPCSHQQFVDAYRGRKKENYQMALDEIINGRSDLERDSHLNVFVKFEKTDHTTKKDPVPRVISPRNPKFNIRVGRYLKPLEERLFKSLGKMFGHRTVIKGLNAVRRDRKSVV